MANVVICIATCNRPQGLRRTLASLAALETRHRIDVLVADNDAREQQGLAVVEALATSGYRWPIEALLVRERGIPLVRNALVEAMAVGLPVVSTDCRSGPREILAPDTDYSKKAESAEFAEYGILVPECSGNKLTTDSLEKEETILSEAMLALVEDQALRERYREKSVKRARLLTPEEALSQWESLIGRE